MTSRSRPGTRAVPLAVLAVLLLPLAGCSGGDEVSDARARASEIARNAGSEGVTASEAAGATGGTSGAKGTATVNAKRVCADIDAAVDSVTSKDSLSTQAKLLGVLSTLFAPGGALEGKTGSALDGVTGKACPAVRDKALKQAGIDSFGKI